MKEFSVGLLVILVLITLSAIGIFFMPFIVVLGYFVQWIIALAFFIFAIWLIGKVTLWGIERLRKK